jgi:hypothetical protein
MTFFGVNSNTNKNITHRRRRRGTTDQWDNWSSFQYLH